MKHTKYLNFLLLVLLSLFYQKSFSQKNLPLSIKGSLVNEQGKAVDYATITLLKPDGVFVKRALSSETGIFTFNDIQSGQYQLTVTAIGHLPAQFNQIVLGNSSLTLPVIALTQSSEVLKEITVSFKRPSIEQKDDKVIANVGGSVLSAGSNALEILSRIPGVSLDQDNNITIYGKQGVTVMIDDKKVYLSNTQLATLLASTDGNLIQSVEIMNNPSAKYDAAGNAGILNIKLKKNKQNGTNGSVTAGLGIHPFNGDISVSLNHKSGKFSSFLNLSHGDKKEWDHSIIDRQIDSSGRLSYLNQTSLFNRTYHNNTYRLGTDYEISKRNTIGIEVNGISNNLNQLVTNTTDLSTVPGITESYLNTVSNTFEKNRNFGLNLNDKFRIDSTGQVLTANLGYSRSDFNRTDDNRTQYFLNSGLAQRPDFYLRQQTPSVINIRTAQLDYVLPMNKTSRFELGAKYSDVNTDNQLDRTTHISGESDGAGAQLNTRFTYLEKIAAGYINYSSKYGATSLQVGLRAEYTNSTGTLDQLSAVKKRYMDWFPNLILNQTLNDQNQLGLKYSRRVERPQYDELNPFIYYTDDYNYNQGNAFLKPEYTTNYELNYNYNKILYVSLGYNHTSDVISQVLLTDTVKKTTAQTYLNLKTLNRYYLNVSYPYTITKWWNGNLNASLLDNQYKTDDATLGNYNSSKMSYELKATALFELSKNYKLEVLSEYRSSKLRGIYNYQHLFNTDLGLSYSFDHQKMNLKFSANDIFNTYVYHININNQKNQTEFTWKPSTQNARLTFTYNFGHT